MEPLQHDDRDRQFVPFQGSSWRLAGSSSSSSWRPSGQVGDDSWDIDEVDECISLLKDLRAKTWEGHQWVCQLNDVKFAGQIFQDCDQWLLKAASLTTLIEDTMMTTHMQIDLANWRSTMKQYIQEFDSLHEHVTIFLANDDGKPEWGSPVSLDGDAFDTFLEDSPPGAQQGHTTENTPTNANDDKYGIVFVHESPSRQDAILLDHENECKPPSKKRRRLLKKTKSSDVDEMACE